LGPKEVVAVFDLRNKYNKPFISPDRFRTTVAIMAAFKSESLITTVTKNGITNAFLELAIEMGVNEACLPEIQFLVPDNRPSWTLQFFDVGRSSSQLKVGQIS
jgi:hypothetical protein